MALQKQLAHLSLTGGLQRKDDERLVIPSKLVVADNVEFDDASTVVRRGGQFRRNLTATASPSIGQAIRCFPHQGNVLIENTAGLHKVWVPAGTTAVAATPSAAFSCPSVFSRAGMTTARVGSVNKKYFPQGTSVPSYSGSYDCAYLSGLTCYVWESRNPDSTYTNEGIRVEVVDEATGAHVYSSFVVTSGSYTAVKPRVLAYGTKFYIYYAEFVTGTAAFDIKAFTITASTMAVTAAGTVTSGTVAVLCEQPDAILYDVAVHANGVIGVVAQTDNALFTILSKTVSTTDGYTTAFGFSSSTNASAAFQSLTALVTYDNTDYRVHAFFGLVASRNCVGIAKTLAGVLTAETVVLTHATNSPGRIVAYEQSATQIIVACDYYLTTTIDYSQLNVAQCTHTYGTITTCTGATPWFIAGRIASCNGRLYLPMLFSSPYYQSTYYIIDLTSVLLNLGVAGTYGGGYHVVARIDYGESDLVFASTLRTETRVPSLLVSSNKMFFAYTKWETDLRIVGTNNLTEVALSSATVDFDSQLGHEEVNGLTWLAGACPQVWDGSYLVEEGFHHAPEIYGIQTLVASGTYSFPNATATYTICFTYAWQDAQGNWWESGPSNEVSVSVTMGGNLDITPTVLVPPTLKPRALVVMYRTLGSSTDTSLYTAGLHYVTSLSEASLPLSEQLYTAGGVLPNTPAPACRHVSNFQGRLVLSGCGEGDSVHWSKVTARGFGVEFSSGDPTHQTKVPKDKGRVVGTKEIDDRLVVFCENSIGVISGTGPSPTGTQGQYSDFATAVPDIGADWDAPKAIHRSLGGIWFQSPFGMRFFSQGGALGIGPDGKQLGSEVDDLVSGISVALSGGTKQQVRFYQTGGTVLVYDYQWQQWTRFTGADSIDAVVGNGILYHLSNYNDTTPMLRCFDSTYYRDFDDDGGTNTEFTGYIETPWLSFAGIQGFQRIYRLMVLGRNIDSSVQTQTMAGTIGYDYVPVSPPTGETFSAVVTPTTGGLVQFQHHFAKQKCESIKIGISFKPTTSNTGRLRLTDLTLQVGVKPGYYKLPSGQRY